MSGKTYTIDTLHLLSEVHAFRVSAPAGSWEGLTTEEGVRILKETDLSKIRSLPTVGNLIVMTPGRREALRTGCLWSQLDENMFFGEDTTGSFEYLQGAEDIRGCLARIDARLGYDIVFSLAGEPFPMSLMTFEIERQILWGLRQQDLQEALRALTDRPDIRTRIDRYQGGMSGADYLESDINAILNDVRVTKSCVEMDLADLPAPSMYWVPTDQAAWDQALRWFQEDGGNLSEATPNGIIGSLLKRDFFGLDDFRAKMVANPEMVEMKNRPKPACFDRFSQ